jgi:hypothetical protein
VRRTARTRRDGELASAATAASRVPNDARDDRIEAMVFAADLGLSTTFGFTRAGWF